MCVSKPKLKRVFIGSNSLARSSGTHREVGRHLPRGRVHDHVGEVEVGPEEREPKAAALVLDRPQERRRQVDIAARHRKHCERHAENPVVMDLGAGQWDWQYL